MIRTRRSPRQIIEGEGSVEAVGDLARQFGTRAMVLTDPIIAAQSGFATILDSLKRADVEVHQFDEAVVEVPVEVVDRAVARAREVEPDVLVAVGGGTVIDLGKVVAALLVHGGRPQDYYGENLIPGPVLPLIAIPTTAGTGSEVTTVAVLSDPDRALKVGISSVHLVPAFAICDPEMTYSCPPHVTAFSGIDAVCHAVEAFTAVAREIGWRQVVHGVSIGKNPYSDEHALRAMQDLGPNLARVVEDGSDKTARAAVMRGATSAGIAFGHAGVGAPHALQYPIGAATKTPHGLGVGLLLPYVLTANRPIIDGELVALADCLEVDGADRAEAFIEWVVDLNAGIGVPSSLRDIGVRREQLRGFAELAATVTRILQNDPGDTSVDGLERILIAAWEGDRTLLHS
ncbi:MAG: iron-containing alcohol dehydrogenase [Nitriliruptoraceae bacterium]